MEKNREKIDYQALIEEAKKDELIIVKGKKFEYQLVMPGQMESILALSHYADTLSTLSDGMKMEDLNPEKVAIKLTPDKAEALIKFAKQLICKSSHIPKITEDGSGESLKYDELPRFDKNELFKVLFQKLQEGMEGLDDIDFFRPDNTREATGASERPDEHPGLLVDERGTESSHPGQ